MIKQYKRFVESVQNDNERVWAIFQVSKGYGKCYYTRMNKLGSLDTCNYRVKYSDPSVLKFTKKEAIDIIRKEIRFGDRMGIVNDRGVQKLFVSKVKDSEVDEAVNTLLEGNEERYRIVVDYGYGDRTWLERGLTKEEVVRWFIDNLKYPEELTFEECPQDDGYTYYYEEDHPDDTEEWDWQVS